MLSEINHTQKDKSYISPSYLESKLVKLIEAESRMVVAKG